MYTPCRSNTTVTPVSSVCNLQAGIFMYMAEMRTVTTLFVKLDSYSPEKHKNLLSLQVPHTANRSFDLKQIWRDALVDRSKQHFEDSAVE